MQKVRDFGADAVREWLTDISPILIIITFLLSLFTFGLLKFHYHSQLFSVNIQHIGPVLAFLIAFVSQAARFAFGLAGVRDLVRGRLWLGYLGVGASIGLSVYEHFEAKRMAEFWGNEHWWYAFVFLVWLALAAEIRLLMTMSEQTTEERATGNEQRGQQRSRQNGQRKHSHST